MAALGHVAEDSTADLSTQHSRPLNAAWPVLSSETCLTKIGKGMIMIPLKVCKIATKVGFMTKQFMFIA